MGLWLPQNVRAIVWLTIWHRRSRVVLHVGSLAAGWIAVRARARLASGAAGFEQSDSRRGCKFRRTFSASRIASVARDGGSGHCAHAIDWSGAAHSQFQPGAEGEDRLPTTRFARDESFLYLIQISNG